MKTIIYNKSTLNICGQVQPNTTLEWQIEYNVIPNFDGIISDYDSIETEFERFHLERNEYNEVIALENPKTKEELQTPILQQLSVLDNPRDAEAIFEALKAKGILSDSDLPQETMERFTLKQELRSQLEEV